MTFLLSPFKVFSSICSPDGIKLLRNFSRNDSIVVSRPDNGNSVVVVDRSGYVESMQKIISDNSKFEVILVPIHKYSIKIEDKINNFLRNLKNCKLLSDEFYKKMFTSGSLDLKSINLTFVQTFSIDRSLQHTILRVSIWQKILYQF